MGLNKELEKKENNNELGKKEKKKNDDELGEIK
jgi:hypothetical protein